MIYCMIVMFHRFKHTFQRKVIPEAVRDIFIVYLFLLRSHRNTTDNLTVVCYCIKCYINTKKYLNIWENIYVHNFFF